MAITLNTIRCPQCGANLSVEEGRANCFCTYCGCQIVLTNENEHVYRHIDEAGITQAETERILRIREMELEERENNKNRKSCAIAFGIALAFVVIGALICIEAPEAGMWGIIIGGYIALFAFLKCMIDKKKANRRHVNSDEVSISEPMIRFREKNYNSVVSLFISAGFSNVNAVPLNDLNFFNRKKNGQVETVSINGDDDFDEGDIFPKNSNVLITYHSRR